MSFAIAMAYYNIDAKLDTIDTPLSAHVLAVTGYIIRRGALICTASGVQKEITDVVKAYG